MTRIDKAIHLTNEPGEPTPPPVDESDPGPPPALAIGMLDRDELAAIYAYPADLDRPWIRANFITSIDGAVSVDGLSGGLATPSDQRIYHLLRSLCDVVLVGKGTVVAENYGPVRFDAQTVDLRVEAGLAPFPPVAVVTASADLPTDHRLFGSGVLGSGEVAPIVLTGSAAPDERVAALTDAGARVIRVAGPTVDPVAIGDALAELHLLRVLCEGGPRLIGSMIEANTVDDFCLTTAPVLCAGTSVRATASPRGAALRARRAALLTDVDGTIATRWLIDRDPTGTE